MKNRKYENLKLDVRNAIEEETKLAPYQVRDLMSALDKVFKKHEVDGKLEP